MATRDAEAAKETMCFCGEINGISEDQGRKVAQAAVQNEAGTRQSRALVFINQFF